MEWTGENSKPPQPHPGGQIYKSNINAKSNTAKPFPQPTMPQQSRPTNTSRSYMNHKQKRNLTCRAAIMNSDEVNAALSQQSMEMGTTSKPKPLPRPPIASNSPSSPSSNYRFSQPPVSIPLKSQQSQQLTSIPPRKQVPKPLPKTRNTGNNNISSTSPPNNSFQKLQQKKQQQQPQQPFITRSNQDNSTIQNNRPNTSYQMPKTNSNCVNVTPAKTAPFVPARSNPINSGAGNNSSIRPNTKERSTFNVSSGAGTDGLSTWKVTHSGTSARPRFELSSARNTKLMNSAPAAEAAAATVVSAAAATTPIPQQNSSQSLSEEEEQKLSSFQQTSLQSLRQLCKMPEVPLERSLNININNIWIAISKCILHGICSVIGILTNESASALYEMMSSFVKRNMVPAQYDLLPPLIKFCSEDYKLLPSTPGKLAVSEFCTQIMELFLPVLSIRLNQSREIISTAVKSSTITQVDFKVVSIFLPVIAKACSTFHSIWKTKKYAYIIIRQTKRFAFINRLNNALYYYNKKKMGGYKSFILDQRMYLNKLKSINDDFYEPLIASDGKFISTDEIELIFGVFIEIYNNQKQLCQMFDSIGDMWPNCCGIPRAIIDFADHINSYPDFMLSIEISRKELEFIREKNKNLNTFLEKKASQSFNSLDVSGLFTAPLNIITVYNRVLKVIEASMTTITYYDEEGNECYQDDPDSEDFGPASEIIANVSTKTLTSLQNVDERYSTIKVMQRLGGVSSVTGDSNVRRFIIEDDVTVVYPKKVRPMRYFLFNDVLVFGKGNGKSLRAKNVIPLNSITISSFVTPKKVGKPVLPSFQMVYVGGDVLTLKFAGSSEKDKLWNELSSRVKEIKIDELYDPSDPLSVAHVESNASASSLSSSSDLSASGSSPIFGSTITAIVALEHREDIGVPSIVEKACVHLMRDLDCEGIFRLSGSSSKIATLKKGVSNPNFAFSITDDNLTVAALLKMFFRELEEPLFTFELYDEFISLGSLPLEEFIESTAIVLNKMPFEHIQTFMYLMDFLVLIAQHKDNNKMDEKNISIVFTPNLLRPRSVQFGIGDMNSFTILTWMLESYDEIKSRIETTQTLFLPE